MNGQQIKSSHFFLVRITVQCFKMFFTVHYTSSIDEVYTHCSALLFAKLMWARHMLGGDRKKLHSVE